MNQLRKALFSFGFFACLFVCIESKGQYADFLWAKAGERQAGANYGKAVCADPQGNVIFAGTFNDTIIFGIDTLISPATQWQIFLVKYDPLGNVLWARQAGGSGHDWGQAVCVDSIGNIYLAGSFASPVAFFGTDTLLNSWPGVLPGPYPDIFIAKYSASGGFLWARSNGNGYRIDEATAIAYDGRAGVCISGRYTSDTLIFGNDTVLNYGDVDAFLAKYDTSGNILWAKGAGSFSEDWALGMDCDTSGNVYVSGWMDGVTANFGDTSYSCNVDFFVAKYNQSGDLIWALSPESDAESHAESVSIDKNGNVLVAGSFYGGEMVFGTDTLTPIGGSASAFVVKYDSSGNPSWERCFGGPGGFDYVESVTSDPNNNVYVTGPFSSPGFMFGSASLSNTWSSYSDSYVAKYSPAGAPLWAAKIGGHGQETTYSVATDNSGNVYCSGLFGGPACSFGSVMLPGNASAYNAFVAKIDRTASMFEFADRTEVKSFFYPNPFSNLTTFKIVNFQNENYELKISDLSGRSLATVQIRNAITEIHLESVSSGMYLYQLTTTKGMISSGKLIVE